MSNAKDPVYLTVLKSLLVIYSFIMTQIVNVSILQQANFKGLNH